MFKSVNAKTTDEYLANLPEERRIVLTEIDKLIRKTAPKLTNNFVYNMPGYGAFDYTNYKKEKLQWPVISVAAQKNYFSIYVCALENGKYIAEKYKDDLGKVSVGKSCIRFKKLEDLNLDMLKKVIQMAEKSPGLVSTSENSRK